MTPKQDTLDLDEFVAAAEDAAPLTRAIATTLAATGDRPTTLCNLDRRDLHLDGQTDSPRPAIEGFPNALYAPTIAEGETVNGEERAHGTKRTAATIVPVAGSLRDALTDWLKMRPEPNSPANPLFVQSLDASREERVTPETVHIAVDRVADGVTPHDIRLAFANRLEESDVPNWFTAYLLGHDPGRDARENRLPRTAEEWEEIRALYDTAHTLD